jgi:glycosyltransferase involved in cell wall biosynthesis
MKIAIDCRMLGKTGIGVYLENIVYNLLSDRQHQYVLVGQEKVLMKAFGDFDFDFVESSVKPFSLKEVLFFDVSRINACDVFFTPNFNIPGGIKIPICSTIHDVVFLDVKGLTSRQGVLIRKLFLRRAIRMSKIILTVSSFSSSRIKHHFPSVGPVEVVPNGINRELEAYAPDTRAPYPFPYLLYVGNFKRHKGLHTLMKAYLQLVDQGLTHKLVLVGVHEGLRTIDKAFLATMKAHQDHIVFAGHLTNQQLYATMTHASVLVQPSVYEGFGLPPLEALFLNTQVVVSDITVFREIYGEFPVHFFASEDVDDLAVVLKRVLLGGEILFISHEPVKTFYNYSKAADNVLRCLEKSVII